MNNLFNYKEFIEQNIEMLSGCKYPYYKTKASEIVRKIFYSEGVTADELIFLAEKTGITIDAWCQKIENYKNDSFFTSMTPEDDCIKYTPIAP